MLLLAFLIALLVWNCLSTGDNEAVEVSLEIPKVSLLVSGSV